MNASHLPPTVNLHLVAHCNYACRYCYAHFEQERKTKRLELARIIHIMRQLKSAGVRRVTFAGGEPTLHPDLHELLHEASKMGLITGIVTNGALIDEQWITKFGKHLRWITLSIDSVHNECAQILGRGLRNKSNNHPEHIKYVAQLIHRFNATRPPARRIRLKMNITVTALNSHEDPSEFMYACKPEKIKLLQMLLVRGENDAESELMCADDAFKQYLQRVQPLAQSGIEIVAENNELMDGSYAMIDPLGRFYQRVNEQYVRSRPISEVGLRQAWSEVGGYNHDKFIERKGDYRDGEPAIDNYPFWIAIEGLDGSGKSTIATMLAKFLDANIVTNPPQGYRDERPQADALPNTERREWYIRANAMAAAESILHLECGKSVVMDRCAASTLAFGSAEQGRISAHNDWPDHIRRPDHIFFLDVSEHERCRRISGRNISMTQEETLLMRDASFRQNVINSYLALGARRICAEGNPESIAREIYDLIQGKNLA